MKKILLVLLILGLTAFQSRHYFRPDFPYTHDGENHLARFANYKVALKEGQIPPRFAPNLMNHYGYPVFNFNYPLANIASLPLSFIKLNPEVSFKLIVMSSFFLGLAGVWKLTHFFKLETFPASLTILLFGLNPYFTNLLLYRGNIGELMALCFLPWLVYSIHHIEKVNKFTWYWIAVWALFFLSHNLSVVLFTPWLLIYGALLSWKKKEVFLKILLTIISAFLLTTWFWLPAVFEAKYTVVQQANLAKDFLLHFPTFSQLLFGQMQFGFSIPGPIDTLSFQLGLAQLLVFSVVVFFIVQKIFKDKKIDRLNLFLVLTGLFAIYLQLSMSTWFWSLFSGLQILQFPWRLSAFFVILIPLMWCYFAKELRTPQYSIVLAFLILQMLLIFKLAPADFFHRQQIDYDLYTQSTSTQNENRAKDFTYLEIGDWKPAPAVPPNATLSVESWTGSARLYSLTMLQEGRVTEPTMYFPGWKTTVYTQQEGKVVEYIDPQRTDGRIAFILPAGQYKVRTIFTQETPARFIGNTITLLSMLVLLGLQGKNLIKHHAKSKT